MKSTEINNFEICGHVECVKVLLEKGANIDIPDNVSEESYSSDSIISYMI